MIHSFVANRLVGRLATPFQPFAVLGPKAKSGLAANDPVADVDYKCEPLRMRTAFTLIILSSLVACAKGAAPSASHPIIPVPFQIFTGGDDGLTQRLAQAVRDEFENSMAFTAVPVSAPNVLMVTIPTNVGWEEMGGKTRVTYRLRLERGGLLLGESGGTCWEYELRACAQTVLDSAVRATSR